MRILLVCLLLFLSFSGQAQRSEQPECTFTVEDSATQDAGIAVRIRDILSELEGFENVTVTVSSGIVTLRGTTIDKPTATRLNEIARRVEGVRAVLAAHGAEIRESRFVESAYTLQAGHAAVTALLAQAATAFHAYVKGQRDGKDASPKAEMRWEGEGGQPEPADIPGDEGHHRKCYVRTEDSGYQMHDGSIVIAAIVIVIRSSEIPSQPISPSTRLAENRLGMIATSAILML